MKHSECDISRQSISLATQHGISAEVQGREQNALIILDTKKINHQSQGKEEKLHRFITYYLHTFIKCILNKN